MAERNTGKKTTYRKIRGDSQKKTKILAFMRKVT